MVKSQPTKRRTSIRYLRKKYRRYCLMTALISVTIGIVLGIYYGYMLFDEKTSHLSQNGDNSISSEAKPVSVEALPSGTAYEFSVYFSDGSTADLRIVCDQVLTPQYYAERYSDQYQLSGDEACIVITAELLDTSTAQTFDPQQHIGISIETADGYVLTSYPLKDAEIAGEYDSVLEKGQLVTLYKRYQHDPHREAAYLTLSYTIDDEVAKVYFALPTAN